MLDNQISNTNDLPLVSVVTVCFNAEEEIEETVISILEQTYQNIELIIKDGESKDNTLNIIKKLVKKYPRKKIIVDSSPDNGIYDAMNIAVGRAVGEWVLFMNAGDKFYTKNVVGDIFRDQIDADVVYGHAIVKDSFGVSVWEGNEIIIEDKMPFCHQACFIRSNIVKQYLFDTQYRIAADYNLLLSVYLDGYSFFNSHKIIATFSLDGVSSTDYVAALNEKVSVKISHGCLPSSYKTSFRYKMQKNMAIIKKMIDKYCPHILYGFLRNLYKKYFKHYKKVERPMGA